MKNYPGFLSPQGYARMNQLERLARAAFDLGRAEESVDLNTACREAVRAIGLTERHEVGAAADVLRERILGLLEE